MKRTCPLIVLSLLMLGFQLPEKAPMVDTITSEDMRADLAFLCSDGFQGRLTGTPGVALAAEFIGTRFQRVGLKPAGPGRNGSSWNIQVVDSAGNLQAYTCLALDSSGYPCIAYRNTNDASVKCATWNGTSWGTDTVDGGVFLTIDGQIGEPLQHNDWVVCQSSNYALRLIRPPHMKFFDVLREKLKWGER